MHVLEEKQISLRIIGEMEIDGTTIRVYQDFLDYDKVWISMVDIQLYLQTNILMNFANHWDTTLGKDKEDGTVTRVISVIDLIENLIEFAKDKRIPNCTLGGKLLVTLVTDGIFKRIEMNSLYHTR